MPDDETTGRPSIAALAVRAQVRLRDARLIADGCRHDGELHRAAMRAVFALEDTLFALLQVADAAGSRAVRAQDPLEGGKG